MRLETDKAPEEVVALAKRAWIQMRYMHPALTVTADLRGFTYCPPHNQLEVDEWANKTFIVQESDSSMGDEDFQSFAGAPATEQATLYHFPKENRFILRSNHMLTDGHGVAMFFRDFLNEMARLESESEIIREPLDKEAQCLPCGIFECISAFSPHGTSTFSRPRLQPHEEAVIIPSKNSESDPGPGRAQFLKFSQQQTKEILAITKDSGLKLTAFLHAAIIHAGTKMTPCSPGTKHSTNIIFNLQKVCHGGPPNAESRASMLRIGFWPVQVQIEDNVYQTAARLKPEYSLIANQKEAVVAAMVPRLHQLTSVVGIRASYQGILPSFIGDISSMLLGIYGSFKTREIWMVALPLDERVYLGIQTFDGRLSIRAAYNETYHDDSQVAEFLEKIKQEIQIALMRIANGLDN
ncbi:uncharacterized protein ACLA_033230 [Aspergillus clavatus NRRL 1]|uniref:Uncharacterized protein n=1 Tax=Aspergillus clavatus (strain ATCC 1007 / CBS 513.65 / DSM 816 / NCTC 3887 / NRRL 1 / QM 1276 / 107) TaxID=344612 RepID=A1CSG6_ASPCL|nr:uncharacterized protein ACLA_033230 [Aspergillus clavatus NRRL 1]EAW08587.1 conserved hypothetical protein [Aspergillus clavatus NRRL 1]